jgi:hypothetical protein
VSFAAATRGDIVGGGVEGKDQEDGAELNLGAVNLDSAPPAGAWAAGASEFTEVMPPSTSARAPSGNFGNSRKDGSTLMSVSVHPSKSPTALQPGRSPRAPTVPPDFPVEADVPVSSADRGEKAQTVMGLLSSVMGRPVKVATHELPATTVSASQRAAKERSRRRGTSRGVRGGRDTAAAAPSSENDKAPSSTSTKASSAKASDPQPKLKIPSLVTAPLATNKLPASFWFPAKSSAADGAK